MTTLSQETNQLNIATALSDKLIATMDNEYGGLGDKIRHYRDLAWAGKKPNVKDILRNTAPDEHEALLTGLTRLGQMYDMAALVARDNALRDEKTISLDAYDTLDDALRHLNTPVFEVTMTAHPTNVNDINSIKALREIGEVLHKNPDAPELDGLIAEWVKQPLIPTKQDANGKTIPGVLSIADETEMTLHYLDNMYEDLPLTYKAFDDAMAEKYSDYDPSQLNLNMRYSSWGSSGDKDGNNNVTSETTLEAIAMHKYEIVENYLMDLEHAGITLDRTDGKGETWNEALSTARAEIKTTLKAIQHELHEVPGRQDKYMDPDRFDELTQALVTATAPLHKKTFSDDIDAAYGDANDEEKKPLLDLSRRVKSFGFNFGRIEYRETADEYSRVVADIIPGYADMNELERENILTEILSNDDARDTSHAEALLEQQRAQYDYDGGTPNENKTLAQKFLDVRRQSYEIEGSSAAYDKLDIKPIAYQTMRRLKLAREFPEMITTNVLAECESTSNLLEAVFLQAASHSTPKDGSESKEAVMGVIPLFESPEVMKKVGGVMGDAYSNEAYLQHMDKVSEKLSDLGYYDEVAKHQQVQIAHSDNTRRSGLPAARALIHQAHRTIKKVSAEHGIDIEFFEGGSSSDPFRGGIRSISATANQYGLHNFMKFTFQGGDLLNYFNHPGSTTRLYTNNFSHAARKLAEKEASPDEHLMGGHSRNKRAYNLLVEEALINTLPDYQEVFDGGLMNQFMTATQEDFQQVGSRAKARGDLQQVEAQNVRTITFSESYQHAGVVPTFIGAEHLEAHIHEVLLRQDSVKDPDLIVKEGEPVPAKAYKALYAKSAVFRDVVDRMAFGLAMTDLERAKAIPGLEQDEFTQSTLENQYRGAANIVLAAIEPEREKQRRGDKPNVHAPERVDANTASFDAIREGVRNRLPHIKETIEHKSAYMNGVQDIKDAVKELITDPLDAGRQMLMALSHAAIDNVTHGRFVMADDPKYADLMKRPSPAQQAEIEPSSRSR